LNVAEQQWMRVMRWLIRTTAIILAAGVAMPGASAALVYGLPIDILDARFSDGTTLTGEFMLNPYGYVAYGWLTTQDGYGLDGITPIAGFTFATSALAFGVEDSVDAPNVLHIDAGPYIMTLTFEHDLGTPGANPFVLDASYAHTPLSAECQSFSCSGLGGVDTPGNERLIVSGVAMVPEPATAALLAGPLLDLLATRRRT
jgi:hypothetical protein